MRQCGFLLVFTLIAGGAACAAEQEGGAPGDSAPASRVALDTLAGHPDRYLGKTVQVRGVLENAGANFFTDLRVQLRDDQGHAIAVRPWLPTSVPPGPKRPGVTPPATLSQYLGKPVDLTAVVEHGELPKQDEVYYLKVQSAEVVK